MLKNSCVYRFILWLLKCVQSSYTFSKINQGIECITNAFDKSRFKKILSGSKNADNRKNSSAVCKLLNNSLGFALTLIAKLADYCKKGFIFRFFSMLKKNSVILNSILTIPFLCVIIFLVPHNYWNNMLGVAASGLILICSIFSLPKENRNKPTVWFSMFIFFVTLILSTFVSYDRLDSIRFLLFFISAFLLCMGIYLYAYNKERLEKLILYIAVAVFITALIAFVQRALGIEVDVSLTDVELNKGMPGRAYSTFGNPNNYAEFLVLFLPLVYAYILTRKKTSTRIVFLAMALISTGALILTYSRSGWIAFALSALIYVALYNKKYLPLLILLVVLGIPLLPQSVMNRILTIGNLKDSSSSYRFDIWTGCIYLLKDFWFTGVGLGSGGFMSIFPSFAIGKTSLAPHSHMQFMEMFIELGFLGFIAYVCFTFSMMQKSFMASSDKNPLLKNLAIASSAAMSGIILIGFFEYCWFYPRVLLAFFVCVGISMATVKLTKSK